MTKRDPTEKDVKEAVKETWRLYKWDVVRDEARWIRMINRYLVINKNVREAKPNKVRKNIDWLLGKEWERCNVHKEFRSLEDERILDEIAKIFK